MNDLHEYRKDLENWGEEMKRKEQTSRNDSKVRNQTRLGGFWHFCDTKSYRKSSSKRQLRLKGNHTYKHRQRHVRRTTANGRSMTLIWSANC